MKKIIVSALVLFMLAGCTSTMTSKKAEDLVMKEKSNHLGKAKIIETKKETNHYLVQWENEADKSRGVTKVNSKGELTFVEEEIE